MQLHHATKRSLDQSEATASEADTTRPVEVIVWHTQENIVHRMTQLFRASELARAEASGEIL